MPYDVKRLISDDEPVDCIVTERPDGTATFIELELVDDLMALREHDVDAYELLWELVAAMLERTVYQRMSA